MATARVPLASWCPVCDSKDIEAAPLDVGGSVEGAAAQLRPWSCRACGSVWLMALPLRVMNAAPALPLHGVNGGGRRGRK